MPSAFSAILCLLPWVPAALSSMEHIISFMEPMNSCVVFLSGLDATFVEMFLRNAEASGNSTYVIANGWSNIPRERVRCITHVMDVEHAILTMRHNPTSFQGQDVILVDLNGTSVKPQIGQHYESIQVDPQTRVITHSVVCQLHQRVQDIVLPTAKLGGSNGPMAQDLDKDFLCSGGVHPLSGRHLRSYVVRGPPTAYRDSAQDTTVDSGIIYDILATIAGVFKFTFTIQHSSRDFVIFPNGSVGGSLAEVLYGRLDLALDMSYEVGLPLGQVTSYVYYHYLCYVEAKPRRLPVHANVVRVFDRVTWALIGVALALTAATLWMHANKRRGGTGSTGNLSFSTVLEMVFGALFQEYHLFGRMRLDRHGRRAVFSLTNLLWLVVTTVLTMSFMANLKSSLVKKNFGRGTMTIEEMLDKDLTVHTTDLMATHLKATYDRQSHLNQRIVDQAEKKNSIYTLGETFSPISLLDTEGESTILMSEDTFDHFRYSYLKTGADFPFRMIPEWMKLSAAGFFFRPGDDRIKYFDRIIHLMQDSGIINYIFRRHIPFRDVKEPESVEEEKLRVEHFLLPGAALAVGAALATLVAALEIQRDRLRPRAKRMISMAQR